jgi:hypothetical protein
MRNLYTALIREEFYDPTLKEYKISLNGKNEYFSKEVRFFIDNFEGTPEEALIQKGFILTQFEDVFLDHTLDKDEDGYYSRKSCE